MRIQWYVVRIRMFNGSVQNAPTTHKNTSQISTHQTRVALFAYSG